MCVVSMVMDHFREQWEPRIAPLTPEHPWTWPTMPTNPTITIQPGISQEEIEEFSKLLERAREYDRRNNEPECELDEKRQALKRIAKELGVEISFL